MQRTSLLALVFLFFITACNPPAAKQQKAGIDKQQEAAKGELFIIGGGKRPPSLIKSLIQLSDIRDKGYIVILPMSSSVPDTSAWYAKKQFVEQGIDNVVSFNFKKGENLPANQLDSLKNATMIYVSGGDQRRFMDVVNETRIYDVMHTAYENGAMIAGTSAGAAIMSKKMITGDEHKHPKYTGEFRTIEANNIEIADGVGFTDQMIVDQHFVKRMRMNRLISIAIEHPEDLAVGIDESTAIHVEGNRFRVYGQSQVIVIENHKKNKKVQNGLLGARDLRLHVLLPGDKFDF